MWTTTITATSLPGNDASIINNTNIAGLYYTDSRHLVVYFPHCSYICLRWSFPLERRNEQLDWVFFILFPFFFDYSSLHDLILSSDSSYHVPVDTSKRPNTLHVRLPTPQPIDLFPNFASDICGCGRNASMLLVADMIQDAKKKRNDNLF